VRVYTQGELDALIRCPKIITEAPRREMRLDGAHWRNDMIVREQSGEHEFSVFMRMHSEFSENFSIGLKYLPKDGSGEVTLLRCNGPHGEHSAQFDSSHPHAEYHVHRASEEAMSAGLRPEKIAAHTSEFASYQEALAYFLAETSVMNADEHFPNLRQFGLPFAGNGEFV
jgi:hypothetical protein